MSSRVDRAVQRLKKLVKTTDNGHFGLSIESMIEAVVGPAYDDELRVLVSIALEANRNGMSLDEIAEGILALEDWRYSQA